MRVLANDPSSRRRSDGSSKTGSDPSPGPAEGILRSGSRTASRTASRESPTTGRTIGRESSAPTDRRARGAARKRGERGFDPLDPAARHAAQLAPPGGSSELTPTRAPANEEATLPNARISIEELLPQLVKRIAWAGDRRRGAAQLEIGAGRYAGTTVTVHAEDGRVRLELHGNAEVDELRARVAERLARRGIEMDS